MNTPYRLLDVIKYTILHLRANRPCSIRSLRQWLVAQCPGITRQNVDAAMEIILRMLETDGIITWCHLEGIELT